jgi:hypothetical protein
MTATEDAVTPASGRGDGGGPVRLEAAFRRHGHIVWVLRAGDGTWRYLITSEGLPDTVLPSDLIARATIGPFSTEEAARTAGFEDLA